MSEITNAYWSGFLTASLVAWVLYQTFGTQLGRRIIGDAFRCLRRSH